MIAKQTIKALLTLTTLFLLYSATALAAAPETMRVWRAQIQFQTANIGDAGTDDGVKVQLNGANSTWLDYGRDDFERNTNYTYDLKLNGISRLSDLQYLYISKTGTDGWAVKSFSLLINGRAIYTQTFPGSGRWFDTDPGQSNSYFVSFATLRSDDAWVSYVPPFPPLTIPRDEMESRVEGLIGDFIRGNQLEWGHLYGRAVEATRKNNNTLHFDLDLEAAISYLPNPEVDVDFDLEITCTGGTISMKVKNVVVDVDSSPILQVLSLGLIRFLDAEISDRINDSVKNIKIGQDVNIGFCPGISVDGLVNIRFTPPSGGIILATTPRAAAREAVHEAGNDLAPLAFEDSPKAFAMNVEVGEARANEELPYAVSVKSNRAEAGQFEAAIELPTGAQLASAMLEVTDAEGNRSMIGAQAVVEADKVVLHFRDFLSAGAMKTYTVKVQVATAGEIATRVAPLTETETADESAAIKAVTFLQTNGDVTRAKATLKQSNGPAKAEMKQDQ